MRSRKYVDFGKLREAISGPGADTRVWIAAARIDDDPDAMRWDDQLGWLVDVTFYGGPLDGDGPVVCRVASGFANGSGTLAHPPKAGCEVAVAIHDGDPNANPVVIGMVHNGGGCAPPSELFGLPLLEAVAAANHILSSPHGMLAELAGLLRVKAASHLVEGAAISLAGQVALGVSVTPDGTVVPAIDALLKGTLLVNSGFQPLMLALNTYATAIAAAFSLIPSPGGSPAAATAAAAALSQATLAFMITAQTSLSTKARTS